MSNVSEVLVIGSGPIIIGQAAEFDYAGAEANKDYKSSLEHLLQQRTTWDYRLGRLTSADLTFGGICQADKERRC
jgi:hypothetical protein